MRPALRFLLLTAACALATGCVGEASQIVIEPPPTTEGVDVEVHQGAPLDLGTLDRSSPTLSATPTALSAAHGRILVAADSGLLRSSADLPDQLAPVPLRRAEGEPEATGPVRWLSRRASGGVLAAAESGLFHDLDGNLYLSPLSHSLPGPVAQLDAAGEGPDEELWLLPADPSGSVWVVAGGLLHDLRLTGTAPPDAAIALGGLRGLISAGGALYEIDVTAKSARLISRDTGKVHAVDRRADGHLYLATQTGLWERSPDGAWSRRTLAAEDSPPVPVHAVFAGEGALALLATPDAVLQLNATGALARLSPRSGDKTAVAQDDAGDTWTLDDGALVRLHTGAPVSFSEHVQPFITAHCSGCHRTGQGAPVFDFEDYEVAKQKSDRIVLRLQGDGATPMPPQSVEILTRDQYAVVLRWVAGGMKP